MKKEETAPHKFESLSEAHRAFGLPKPKHPLISLLNGSNDAYSHKNMSKLPSSHVLTFYKISYKPKLSARIRYGQGHYDFEEGGLLFASPGQIIGGKSDEAAICSEFSLLIHPD